MTENKVDKLMYSKRASTFFLWKKDKIKSCAVGKSKWIEIEHETFFNKSGCWDDSWKDNFNDKKKKKKKDILVIQIQYT